MKNKLVLLGMCIGFVFNAFGQKKDKNEFTPPSVIYGLPVKSSAKHDSAMRYTSGVIGRVLLIGGQIRLFTTQSIIMKSPVFILLLLMNSYIMYSQSNIRKIIVHDHRKGSTYTTYSRNIIQDLRPHLNDGKFELAVKQFGIIGNDFFNPEEIGMAKAKNSTWDWTDYHPIDGFKRTFCGREIFSRYASDGDFNIVYDIPVTNILLQRNIETLKSGHNYYDWNRFEGEIEFEHGYESYYPTNSEASMIQFPNFGCMYGAWVKEWAGDSDGPNDHKDNNEIHPMEQNWSLNHQFLGLNKRDYHLFLAIDQSGKFESWNDYYSRPRRVWSPDTLSGIFAFAFELNRAHKEKLKVRVTPVVHNTVTYKSNDGNKHFLIFQNDTIATIIEESNLELINVDFHNVGYKGTDNNMLRGFFILRTKLGKITDPIRIHSGNINLNVSYEIKSNVTRSIKATLVKIKRLENNSFRYYDATMDKIYTFPTPVPNNFNETGVTVSFRSGLNRINTTIANLSTGQEYTFNNVYLAWSGNSTDKYFFEILCENDGINLGSSGIGGYPIKSRNESTSILLPYEIPEPLFIQDDNNDNNDDGTTSTTVNTSLFELTFKVELLKSRIGTAPTE